MWFLRPCGRFYPGTARSLSRVRYLMQVFRQTVNPTTGRTEWAAMDENYDYNQEVARSSYTDMLHDEERNKKYKAGLELAIGRVRGRGQRAHVLDIGTGSGLLSMLAAQAGADRVTACECFKPMAGAAKKIVQINGFSDKIKVIAKRSTEMTAGPGGDMEERANILVAELLDTELIGEGCLYTYQHALEHLVTPDCIFVPHAATVYAQVMESDFMWNWHRIQDLPLPGCEKALVPSADMEACMGAAAIHDIQLSQVKQEQFKPLTEPIKVFRFEFDQKMESLDRSVDQSVAVTDSGQAQVILMWWEIEMDPDSSVLLSVAPSWAHPTPHDMQWRDHWMQAVYFNRQSIPVEKGQQVALHGRHDEYSLWFQVQQQGSTNSTGSEVSLERPVCRCGGHMVWSRPRLGMLNDRARWHTYAAALKQVLAPGHTCVSVSDASWVPLIAAQLGAQEVFALESSDLGSRVTHKLIEANNLQDKVHVVQGTEDQLQAALKDRKVAMVIAEPYYTSSLLPWHNLYFWYVCTRLRPQLLEGAAVMPARASLVAVAMEFENLWRLRAPVGRVEGFDISVMDQMVKDHSNQTDERVEPHPLWEYPGVGISDPVTLMNFDLTRPVPAENMVVSGEIPFTCSGSCNAVALWMNYDLLGDGHHTISTGPHTPYTSGRPPQWDPHIRQGVYFMDQPVQVTPDSRLTYRVTFSPKDGQMDFQFDIGNS
ncbi:protein arginine N-methyltransferase 7-like [Branchiostoma floridae x Branchiostoma belcheri]